MYYSIDRFEEDTAVLQDYDGNIKNIPRGMLPDNAKQGDILNFKNNRFIIDGAETARRRDYVRALQQRLIDNR